MTDPELQKTILPTSDVIGTPSRIIQASKSSRHGKKQVRYRSHKGICTMHQRHRRAVHVINFEDDENELDVKMVKCCGFPWSIAFIISNEFCERFNYFGLRTVLVLYLTSKLKYDEETSIMLFHTFTMLVYMFPIVGAIIADSWLGKYETICILSIVYAFGGIVLAMGAIPPLQLPVKKATIVGLVLIAFGTGGIKPCIAAFGGDQFKLPQQAEELAAFFAIFYFAINAGSTISTTITPILRADVYCFGDDSCFALAFGVPAVLMLLSVIIFVSGRSKYIIKAPEGNMIFGIVDCLTQALIGLYDEKREREKHWLDYAYKNVGYQMVQDTKSLIRILVLYLPLPVFWTLFDQQGSRWVFQAARMDGNFYANYLIKPDQMQVINPLLILVFIPLFDYFVYPVLAKIGISKPLQKLTMGGMLAALAFLCAALLELKLLSNEPHQLGYMDAQIRFYNGMPCQYNIEMVGLKSKSHMPNVVEPLTMWSKSWTNVRDRRNFNFIAQSEIENCPTIKGRVQLLPGRTTSYFIAKNRLQKLNYDEYTITVLERPVLRALINTKHNEGPIVLKDASETEVDLRRRALTETAHGQNRIEINGVPAAEFETRNGGIYMVMLEGSQDNGYQYNLIPLKKPNSISILWQLPQIIIITAAEVMFSVTGLEFSFTQAPVSMKSVLQACWLLSVATGNMLVVLLSRFSNFQNHAYEFAFYAALMFVDMLIFIALADNYENSNKDIAKSPERDVSPTTYEHNNN